MSVEAIISSQPPAPLSEITPPPVLTGVFKSEQPGITQSAADHLVYRLSDIGSKRGSQRFSQGGSSETWRYHRGSGRGRGPCGACDSGQQEGHHGGSRCRRRGTLGFNLTSWQSPISINKLPSKSPGFR